MKRDNNVHALPPVVEYQRRKRRLRFEVGYEEMAAAIRSLRLIEDAVLPAHRDPQFDPFTDLLWEFLIAGKGYQDGSSPLGCVPVPKEPGAAA